MLVRRSWCARWQSLALALAAIVQEDDDSDRPRRRRTAVLVVVCCGVGRSSRKVVMVSYCSCMLFSVANEIEGAADDESRPQPLRYRHKALNNLTEILPSAPPPLCCDDILSRRWSGAVEGRRRACVVADKPLETHNLWSTAARCYNVCGHSRSFRSGSGECVDLHVIEEDSDGVGSAVCRDPELDIIEAFRRQ